MTKLQLSENIKIKSVAIYRFFKDISDAIKEVQELMSGMTATHHTNFINLMEGNKLAIREIELGNWSKGRFQDVVFLTRGFNKSSLEYFNSKMSEYIETLSAHRDSLHAIIWDARDEAKLKDSEVQEKPVKSKMIEYRGRDIIILPTIAKYETGDGEYIEIPYKNSIELFEKIDNLIEERLKATRERIKQANKKPRIFKYTYRSRGYSIGCQPPKGLIEAIKPTNGVGFETIVYNRQLTGKELEDYELIPAK